MPTLYLTPASLSYLAQFVLALIITAYLLYLSLRPASPGGKPAHVALITGFFAGFTIYLLLLFLETALLPGDRLFATYLQIIPLTLGLVCLIQFAYRYPASAPEYSCALTLAWYNPARGDLRSRA